MTIQEAIKSGKPFRRSSWEKVGEDDWVYAKGTIIHENIRCELYDMVFCDSRNQVCLLSCDILAEDWEVKDDTSKT